MRKIKAAVRIALCTSAVLVPLLAQADEGAGQPCNQLAPDLLTIDGSGKIQLKNGVEKNYSVKKTDKEITITLNKNWKIQDRVVFVNLDDQGRAATLTDSGKMVMFPNFHMFENHLAYSAAGQCYVEKVDSPAGLYVSTGMCNELVPIFQSLQALNKRLDDCSSGLAASAKAIDAKLLATIQKFGGNINSASRVESTLGLHYASPVTAAAQDYLRTCAEPPIAQSMPIEKASHASSAAAGAADAPVDPGHATTAE